MSKTDSPLDGASTPYVIVHGDFNANLRGGSSKFGRELLRFCHDSNLVISIKLSTLMKIDLHFAVKPIIHVGELIILYLLHQLTRPLPMCPYCMILYIRSLAYMSAYASRSDFTAAGRT